MINYITKRKYTGANANLLKVVAEKKGYKSIYWATFKQLNAAGLKVKKGEKGTEVIGFFKERVNEEDDREMTKRRRFYVFNIEQTEKMGDKTVRQPINKQPNDEPRATLLTKNELLELINA